MSGATPRLPTANHLLPLAREPIPCRTWAWVMTTGTAPRSEGERVIGVFGGKNGHADPTDCLQLMLNATDKSNDKQWFKLSANLLSGYFVSVLGGFLLHSSHVMFLIEMNGTLAYS